jgi:formate dehydrogenase maturation protein FdhE
MTGYTEIIESLQKGAEGHPELAETAGLYCRLLEIEAQADIPAPTRVPGSDEARALLQQGKPLLNLDEIEIDSGKLTELAMQIAFAIAEQRRERVRELADIHAWLHRRRDRMRSLAIAYLRGNGIPDSNSGIDGGLLTFVIHSALRPFLRAYADTLGRFVDAGAWYRGYCPICGGEPDMAALEKSGGRRSLLCSRCDAEWSYRRLGCPFCSNDDPKDLAFFPSDDKVYRLAVCERCHRYIKTVDLRETPTKRPLAAERVLTAGMDVAAESTGYQARA